MNCSKLKKAAAVLVAVCLCVSMAGCKNSESEKKTAVSETAGTNSNSSYVASRTDVTYEDSAPSVTSKPALSDEPESETTAENSSSAVTSVPSASQLSADSQKTAAQTAQPQGGNKTEESVKESDKAPVKSEEISDKDEEIILLEKNYKDNGVYLTQGIPQQERAVYDRIVRAVSDFEREIKFEHKTVTQQQIENCLLVFSLANPREAYVSPKYVISVDSDGYVSKLTLEYTKTKEQQSRELYELEAAVEEILKGCEAADEYEAVAYFHDEIIRRCSYDSQAENMLSAYGCLVDGRAVCEGYAKALILLCSEYGIDCVPVVGTTVTADGIEEPHMWNLVKIEGEWYHFDLTWDDPITTVGDDFVKYDYFGLSDSEISTDHEISPIVYFEYPSADSEGGDYFTKSGLSVSTAKAAEFVLGNEISKAVKNGQRFVRIKVTDKKEFDALNKILFEADRNGEKKIFAMLSDFGQNNGNEHFNPRRYSKIVSEEKNILTIILNYEQ